MISENKVYTLGSIFDVKYKIESENSYINRNLLLIQFKKNKFLFIDMNTGNRWNDKIIKGKDNIVKDLDIINSLYISENYSLNKIDFIKNISELDVHY